MCQPIQVPDLDIQFVDLFEGGGSSEGGRALCQIVKKCLGAYSKKCLLGTHFWIFNLDISAKNILFQKIQKIDILIELFFKFISDRIRFCGN